LALPFFAITLFISAFLLFLVQPMIGKLILPRLGGTPQVWNTCMMFFQTTLLAGYAYTHLLTSRLPTRRQLIVHAIVLFLPLPILFLFGGPFGLVREWTPPPGSNPIFSTLLILTIIVGVPFLVVSTTAPLLQRWFSYTGHPAAKDPYFLYGASNLGSMLALIFYPVLIEPLLGLQSPTFDPTTQTWVWALGYIVLLILVYGAVYMVTQAPPSVALAGPSLPEPVPAEAPPSDPSPVTQIKAAAPAGRAGTGIRKGSKQRGRHTQRPAASLSAAPAVAAAPAAPAPYELTWWRRLRWVLLAAVPSSLMLGVTTYISTDISAIPLFWVIPLALYLLSFILVFLRWPVVWTDVPHKLMAWVQPMTLLILIYLLVSEVGFHPRGSISVCLLAFFATALYCHGELARNRPPTKYLTEFYLWMSVGGMVGGVFNGLLAPVLFVRLLEFPLALVLAGLLRAKLRPDAWTDNLITSAAPGFVDWLGDSGDAIAANFRRPPSAAAGDAAAPPPSPAKLPERGWLLHYSLDFILPGLLGLFFLYLLNHSGTIRTEGIQKTLFNFWYKTMAFEQRTAYDWMLVSYRLLVFGMPLLICFLYTPRPVRFGLGLGALLLAATIYRSSHQEAVIYQDRSYFGILRVQEEVRRTEDGTVVARNTSLMHGTTHHGLNYQTPRELRRLPTTYYHRNGPVGIVMSRIDWFRVTPLSELPRTASLEQRELARKSWNTYWSDARLPVSVIGSALSPAPGALGSPVAQLPVVVSSWSEPAYACVGLGTGTMASYSRPYQHMTFYEIDNKIRSFSEQDYTWPDGTQAPFFNYVHDARKRGARIEIIMGDARFSMAKEMPQEGIVTPQRQHYYRVIELDAFSSDAIPVHLITREAIEMYFTKLVEPRDVEVDEVVKDKDGKVRTDKDGRPVTKRVTKHFSGGVLMVHTSNRHVDLVQPVTDIAKDLKLAWRVGKDRYERRGGPDAADVNMVEADNDPSNNGRFGSEYVMLARDIRDLPDNNTAARFLDARGMLTMPADELGMRLYSSGNIQDYPVLWWYTPHAPGNRVWTDNFQNLLGVFRWR
jgi:hypothetical protein